MEDNGQISRAKARLLVIIHWVLWTASLIAALTGLFLWFIHDFGIPQDRMYAVLLAMFFASGVLFLLAIAVASMSRKAGVTI